MTAPVAYNQEKSCLSGTAIKKDLSIRLYALPFYQIKPPMAGKNKNAVASSGPKTHPPQENIWFGFRQTQQKMTATPSNLEKSIILEHFYRNARTHFSKNQQIRTDVKWKKEDNLRNQPRRLPAKGWPAPPALTFTDFLNFPPPNFFFELGKSQVCRVGCAVGAETVQFFLS